MRQRYDEPAAQLAKYAWAVNSRKHNEVCAPLADNWGWKAGDVQKSADQLWTMLGNAARKNCNLLLNVGPHPDGSLPPDAVKTLRDVGRRIDAEGFPQPTAETGGPTAAASLPQ
jgi:alpha-L-fucosidase